MAVTSKIRLSWQATASGDWMNLEFLHWAKISVEHSNPGKVITDRYGIPHRIIPSATAKKRHWPIACTLEPRVEDLLISADFTGTIDTVDQGNKYFYLESAEQDATALFPVGRQFTVSGSTGNDGTYTVAAIAMDSGKTRITTSEAIPDATADGSIVNTFTLPEVLDFWGVGSYSATVPQSQTLFYIYHYEDGINDDGGDVQKRKAYKCYLANIPADMMGTLVFIDGQTPDMRIEFVITEDGTFDTFTNNPASSYTAHTTARPT